MRGLSLVAASGDHSSSRCAGLSLSRPLLLRSTGSRHAGSVVVAHGPNCSAACGIVPDQGSNPCPLRWQADSQPLRHQGSPMSSFLSPCVQTGVFQGRTRDCLGCGWGPRVWSTLGPCSPPGFFFLWLKADKDICDPSGYQDSRGNSLVSYSALVPTKNGGGKEECSRSK